MAELVGVVGPRSLVGFDEGISGGDSSYAMDGLEEQSQTYVAASVFQWLPAQVL